MVRFGDTDASVRLRSSDVASGWRKERNRPCVSVAPAGSSCSSQLESNSWTIV